MAREAGGGGGTATGRGAGSRRAGSGIGVAGRFSSLRLFHTCVSFQLLGLEHDALHLESQKQPSRFYRPAKTFSVENVDFTGAPGVTFTLPPADGLGSKERGSRPQRISL